jgi:hypothetical protein
MLHALSFFILCDESIILYKKPLGIFGTASVLVFVGFFVYIYGGENYVFQRQKNLSV